MQMTAPSLVGGFIFLTGGIVTAACNLGYLPRKYYRLLNNKASPINKIKTEMVEIKPFCSKAVVCEGIKIPIDRREVKRPKKRFLPKHRRETIRRALILVV